MGRWRAGYRGPDGRERSRTFDCIAVRGDDLDEVSDCLDAALVQLQRPVCGLNPLRRSSSSRANCLKNVLRPNASAPPVGFEPTTQGLGNLCSIP
jgi:hypothetical protein